MNKKGDIESIIYAVIIIFIIGIIFFFFNHVSNSLYENLDEYFNETAESTSTNLSGSYAQETLRDIQLANNSVWDYAFLGVVILIFMSLLFTAYSTRINIAFYWIYGLLSMIVLGLGVILSNIWQEMVDQTIFADTLIRFPITNTLLGTYYPTLVVAIVILAMIFIFGKRSEGT